MRLSVVVAVLGLAPLHPLNLLCRVRHVRVLPAEANVLVYLETLSETGEPFVQIVVPFVRLPQILPGGRQVRQIAVGVPDAASVDLQRLEADIFAEGIDRPVVVPPVQIDLPELFEQLHVPAVVLPVAEDIEAARLLEHARGGVRVARLDVQAAQAAAHAGVHGVVRAQHRTVEAQALRQRLQRPVVPSHERMYFGDVSVGLGRGQVGGEERECLFHVDGLRELGQGVVEITEFHVDDAHLDEIFRDLDTVVAVQYFLFFHGGNEVHESKRQLFVRVIDICLCHQRLDLVVDVFFVHPCRTRFVVGIFVRGRNDELVFWERTRVVAVAHVVADAVAVVVAADVADAVAVVADAVGDVGADFTALVGADCAALLFLVGMTISAVGSQQTRIGGGAFGTGRRRRARERQIFHLRDQSALGFSQHVAQRRRDFRVIFFAAVPFI
mmetsp:Transcript_16582/g.32991  ORF Transcript_16582/g.32991 Transcript_16582/m.32991 type:complete len:441 (+) Transcript_16582:89-1411(+)|eukprot:CAMPEP_0194325536 /NCGR_PEP_ID=MMETSP0171-20130528/31254_1 /TAXON_ID=218684 /ORGANISM="Corethron pennatum, Strain L29A3" /LENGTH=440 /DNA_ID=CAMNT_0039084719 /DNA_START=13 /DNA_END=1335 /DNA_ORIENTATION=-